MRFVLRDGIVGPRREKEGSYWAIKEVWSPVHLELGATDALPASFDGRLRVSTDRVGSHTAAVALVEVKSARELFRVDSGAAQRVRAAFSADGRHLLANWQSEGSSWVDVWRI